MDQARKKVICSWILADFAHIFDGKIPALKKLAGILDKCLAPPYPNYGARLFKHAKTKRL